eukprot:94041-Pelagomonas_calceolata.AAC.4
MDAGGLPCEMFGPKVGRGCLQSWDPATPTNTIASGPLPRTFSESYECIGSIASICMGMQQKCVH